jgi:hypothetical protein
MVLIWNDKTYLELTRPGRARMRTRQNIVFDGEWFEDDFGHRFFVCDNGGRITYGYNGDATYKGPVVDPLSCDDPHTLEVEVPIGLTLRD